MLSEHTRTTLPKTGKMWVGGGSWKMQQAKFAQEVDGGLNVLQKNIANTA